MYSTCMTQLSGYIRFMGIFAGVSWRGGVKRQWRNRKRRFSVLLDIMFGIVGNKAGITYVVLFSPSSPFYLPENSRPWMTLSGNFMFNSVSVHVRIEFFAYAIRKQLRKRLLKVNSHRLCIRVCRIVVTSSSTFTTTSIESLKLLSLTLQTLQSGAREPWRERRDRSPNLYAVAPLPIFCSPKFWELRPNVTFYKFLKCFYAY